MSKKIQNTDAPTPKEQGPALAATGTSNRESHTLTALRTLVSKINHQDNNNHSSPPFQAPLVEVEHEGMIYSLFCRKKHVCPAFVELSPREKDIARMIATGLPNKTIAATLEISEWTVSTHLRRIFAKLGVSCRAAMVSKWLDSHNHCKAEPARRDTASSPAQPFQVQRGNLQNLHAPERNVAGTPVISKLVVRT